MPRTGADGQESLCPSPLGPPRYPAFCSHHHPWTQVWPCPFLGCLATLFLACSSLYKKRCVTSSVSSPTVHWAASPQRRNLKLGKSDTKSLNTSDKCQGKLDTKIFSLKAEVWGLFFPSAANVPPTLIPPSVGLREWWDKPTAGGAKDPPLILRSLVKGTKRNKHKAPDEHQGS